MPWGDWWDAFYPQTLRKPRGLIASYRTEETSGEQWWDEFGAQHALLRGAPTRTTDATLGSTVMSSMASDDYAAFDRSVATPRVLVFRLDQAGNAVGADEPMLFLGSSATKALQLVPQRRRAGRLHHQQRHHHPNAHQHQGPAPNVWRHVAITLDGGTGKLYLDGALEATATVTLKPLDVLAANNDTAMQANYLGRDWSGAPCSRRSFDDVRFYNVALTAAEVLRGSVPARRSLGQFSPTAPTDFNGTSTIAQSGVRNGRVRTLAAWVKPRTSPRCHQL